MGLDCTAYSKLEAVRLVDPTVDYDESGYDEGLTQFWLNPSFHGAEGSIKRGTWYSYENRHGFRAGSYGGYNMWREELSQLVLGVDPHVVWDNPEPYLAVNGVARLVHFSDCEGVLGTESCQRVYEDLKAYIDNGGDLGELNSWGRLDEWITALELAVDDGAISFH